jgi:hypothetical protein
MKNVSKKIIASTICGLMFTGILGGISEASSLPLNNNLSPSQVINYDRDDHRDNPPPPPPRYHHERRHHDHDNNDNVVAGVVVGAILGVVIANNT